MNNGYSLTKCYEGKRLIGIMVKFIGHYRNKNWLQNGEDDQSKWRILESHIRAFNIVYFSMKMYAYISGLNNRFF